MELQVCIKCKIEKPISEFYKCKKSITGHKKVCARCCLNDAYIYYQKNKEKIIKYQREYRTKNEIPEKQKIWRKEYGKQYKKRDYVKIANHLRTRIWKALHGRNSGKSMLEFLGCSINELQKYIESLWQEGMSWENYGYYGWHLDHILPCVSFNLKDIEECKKCFHYTNLQPLWGTDNLRKRSKVA